MTDSTLTPPQSSTKKISFSEANQLVQFAWDSTSLGALKTCPRYYYYSILCGYVSIGDNVHLTFGLAFHSALEAYDRRKAEGASHEDAEHHAVFVALRDTWNDRLSRPWMSDHPNKNRETLVRSIVWYLEQFADDPLETMILRNGKPAVELSFRLATGVTNSLGDEILLCGHLDRVVRWEGKPWIVDRKTTKTTLSEDFFRHWSPENQMSLYDIAGEMILEEPIGGIIIDAAQIAVEFTRFMRGQVTRWPSQREEWMQDAMYYIGQAEKFAKDGYWPMNDKSCDKYGGCPYRTICSASPDVRQQLISTIYQRRTWDPLQTREV